MNNKEKERISKKLAKRINKAGVLMMHCDETRSQFRNKQILINRFFEMLEEALMPEKKRKPTKVPKKAVEKRLEDKRRKSIKKQSRQDPDF